MILAVLVALSGIASATGQGQLTFYNHVPGVVDTRVYAPLTSNPYLHQIGNGPSDTPAGTTDWSSFTKIGTDTTGGPFGATNTLGQLLGAPGTDQAESSLQLSFPITTFRTGIAAGLVAGVTATFNNISWQSAATMEMVAWDNSSGLYPTWTQASIAWDEGIIAAGKSGTFNIVFGNFAQPLEVLAGLQSFNLYYIPEPSPLWLAGLGIAVSLFRRFVPPAR